MYHLRSQFLHSTIARPIDLLCYKPPTWKLQLGLLVCIKLTTISTLDLLDAVWASAFLLGRVRIIVFCIVCTFSSAVLFAQFLLCRTLVLVFHNITVYTDALQALMPAVCYDGFSMHGEGIHMNALQAYCNTGQRLIIRNCMDIAQCTVH